MAIPTTYEDIMRKWNAGTAGPVKVDYQPTALDKSAIAAQQPQQIGVTAPMNQSEQGWFGQGGYLDMGSQGLAALSGLANAYTGYKGLKLAEDQFNAEKGFANRNLANQAQQYNTGLMNSANVGLALAGSSLTPEQKQAYLQSVEKQQLSTAPVA